MGDDSTIHLLYGLLIGALTIALSVIGFFLVRTINQIDGKADKDAVTRNAAEIEKKADSDVVERIEKTLENIQDRQETRHSENRKRLDDIADMQTRIWAFLAGGNGRASGK